LPRADYHSSVWLIRWPEELSPYPTRCLTRGRQTRAHGGVPVTTSPFSQVHMRHDGQSVTLLTPRVMLLPLLLYHLIRPQQQRRRDGEAEGLSGLEVDDELEFRRLLDGQVGGFGTLENLVNVRRGSPPQICEVRSVRHQPARIDKFTKAVD